MTNPNFSKNIKEFLFLLHNHKVKYLIVGGEAVIYYGHARLTGDIDIFYDSSKRNILIHSITPLCAAYARTPQGG